MNHTTIRNRLSYLDTDEDALVIKSHHISLTRTQVHVLSKLIEMQNHPVCYSELIRVAWGKHVSETVETKRKLYVFMHRLRNQIKQKGKPQIIITVKGLGYLFSSMDRVAIYPNEFVKIYSPN